jgi:hypothetical protein
MTDLFYMGGPLFMGILTVILFAVLATTALLFLKESSELPRGISVELVKELGIFGLVTGIFSQFLGLYEAFNAIEQMGTVSQSMLVGGLKVSSITTIYGLLIFIVAWLLYFGLKMKKTKE